MFRCTAFWLTVLIGLPYAACAQVAVERLDEMDGWLAVGDGISAQRVSAAEAPEGVEGAGAVHCTIDAAGRTQVYLRCPIEQHDLTGFAELRFRLYGELTKSIIGVTTLIDSQWRHRQWLPPSLRTGGQEREWTEFVLALDSPGNDHGADLRDIQWITWFIIIPAGETETGGFYIDGVRFTPREDGSPEPPGPEQVVLSDGGCTAVFDRETRYELAEVRLASGETIAAPTGSQVAPLEVREAAGSTVRLGGRLEWIGLDAAADRLAVEYLLGGYRVQNTFTLADSTLRVDRAVTALEAGVTSFISQPQVVSLGDAFSAISYEHGQVQSSAALPSSPGVELPGNWVTATSERANLAVVFPRAPYERATVEGTAFAIADRITRQGTDVPAGSRQEYTMWLRPLEAGASVDVADETARGICAQLVRDQSPLRAYLAPRHQPFARTSERVLVNSAACSIWQASPSRAIRADEPLPEATDETVRISAARGETEPIHLGVRPSREMGTVTAACTELRSGEAVIAAERCRTRYGAYIDLRASTETERQSAEKPEWAEYVGVIEGAADHLHTDRFYASKARVLGEVEDPLFDSPPVTLAVGRNQPVWITVSVPADAAAGNYSGEIVLREGQAELARIPLELRVWSFELPRVASLRTWYQLWRAPGIDVEWQDYYRDLAEHKVSGFGTMPVDPRLSWEDGRVQVDWSAYDESAEYLFDELGLRHAKFPHGKRGGGGSDVYPFLDFAPGTPEFETAYEDYLQQAREHLTERGWLADLDCYIFDEPDRERIEVIRQTAPIIRRRIPELRIFPACAKNTLDLIGVLNAWCPPVNHFGAPIGDFTAERVQAGRERGDVYWWYNQDDNAIGCPIVTHRALLWASWQERMTGYFVWAVSFWGTQGAKWVSPYEIGDAMAIYPGLQGPVDSIRWEQTREGLEDYEYLVMLEQAVADNSLPAEKMAAARELLAHIHGLLPDPRCQLAADPEELLQLRQQVGELLDTGVNR